MTLLIVTNYKSFSQTVTNKIIDSTKITLNKEVVRLIVKDLIKYDICTEELKLTNEKNVKLNEIVQYKDSVISLYKEKDKNWEYITNEQKNQISEYKEMSTSLKKELRGNKFQKIVYKLGTYLFGITSTIFIVKEIYE